MRTTLSYHTAGTRGSLPFATWAYAALRSASRFAGARPCGTHVPALGYIVAFGLAWLARGRALLSHFAPVGRAALSNYLAQTILIVLLMYSPGLGLSLRLPVWTCLPIGVASYVAQTFVSRWWLDKNRYGPAEWVWRMMTYRRRFALAAAAYGERAGGA